MVLIITMPVTGLLPVHSLLVLSRRYLHLPILLPGVGMPSKNGRNNAFRLCRKSREKIVQPLSRARGVLDNVTLVCVQGCSK